MLQLPSTNIEASRTIGACGQGQFGRKKLQFHTNQSKTLKRVCFDSTHILTSMPPPLLGLCTYDQKEANGGGGGDRSFQIWWIAAQIPTASSPLSSSILAQIPPNLWWSMKRKRREGGYRWRGILIRWKNGEIASKKFGKVWVWVGSKGDPGPIPSFSFSLISPPFSHLSLVHSLFLPFLIGLVHPSFLSFIFHLYRPFFLSLNLSHTRGYPDFAPKIWSIPENNNFTILPSTSIVNNSFIITPNYVPFAPTRS